MFVDLYHCFELNINTIDFFINYNCYKFTMIKFKSN